MVSKGNLAEEGQVSSAHPVQNDPLISLGQFLADTREEQGLSLREIAKITNIRYLYLAAIEKGDIKTLPGRVYTIGFIKSYAHALKLNGDEILRQANLLNHLPEYSITTIPTPLPDQDLPASRILILSGLIVIGIVVAAYLWQRSPNLAIFDDASQQAVEPLALIDATPPPVATEVPAPSVSVAPLMRMPLFEQTAQNSETQSIHPLTITAKSTSWVEIMDKENKKIVSKLLTAGEVITVPRNEGLTLSTGNIGGIEISANGKVIPSLGPIGHLKKGIKLDESLLEIKP